MALMQAAGSTSMADLFIGLMSGTSLDGVDGVIASFDDAQARTGGGLQVLAHASRPFERAFRAELLSLNARGDDELHRAALAANALVRHYAEVVLSLLAQAALGPRDIRAIGAHGQTVRHRPGLFDGTGYTLQLNQPALLAELTGIDVVADFRSRDVAAGGQGAPLAPFFHRAQFARHPGQTVGVLNWGGIANLTLLFDDGGLTGFDCGPANALLDAWCLQHTGQPYDEGGRWAGGGRVVPALLQRMLAEPFFALAPPKSTGRDLFNMAWLEALLAQSGILAPQDVQATLAELTVLSSAAALRRHGPQVQELIVCGGGALNEYLLTRLQHHTPKTLVVTSSERGLPPLQVEATAFAWLARACVLRQPLELPKTTGAQGARVLGAVYPAG